MSQTIFITGASSGLGKAASILFAEKGWQVLASMRKPEQERELDAYKNITKIKLDVTDPAAIQKVAAQVTAGHKIHVVLNNAGYGLAGPFEGADDEQLTRQLDTNLLGTMRVTQAFIPHFRANGTGLFINVTSIGGLITFPYNSVYHATKWGLEGWSESLAFELKQFGIGVKTVSPGGIATDFAGRSLVLTGHEAYAGQIQKVMARFMDPERQKTYSSAEQIAQVVYKAATDGKDTLRYVAGEDAKALYAQRQEMGDEAFRHMIEEAFLK